MGLPQLTPNQIEQIANIMGDTNAGFTGSELEHLLAQCHMADPDPGLTKRKRLYNAFEDTQESLSYCVEKGSTNTTFIIKSDNELLECLKIIFSSKKVKYILYKLQQA